MKKLVFALCMFFGAVVVNAQDTTSTSSPTDPSATEQSHGNDQLGNDQSGMEQEEGRVKIKSQDLPESVKSSLEGQEYRGWLVNSAYKVEGSSSTGAGQEGQEGQEGQIGQEGQNQSDTTSVSSETEAGAAGAGQEVYIVELKNGAQTKTVRFDKDGKKLDDGEEMNDDQK